MGNTLLLANQSACAARAQGRDRLADAELTLIRSRYLGALAKGLDENLEGRSRLAKAARTLIRRFQKHEAMILRFCCDLRVPFTNNVAEVRYEVARFEWLPRWEGRLMIMKSMSAV